MNIVPCGQKECDYKGSKVSRTIIEFPYLNVHQQLSNSFHRKRSFVRLFLKASLATFLFIMFSVNVVFIYTSTTEAGQRMTTDSLSDDSSFPSQEYVLIKVISSQTKVSVDVDGTTVVEDDRKKSGRGIHVVVLNEKTASVMAIRTFDTYTPHQADSLSLFLNMVSDKRIIIFAIKDEGTFQMKNTTRNLLKKLGSKKIDTLGWRDMWAMVTIKGERIVGEAFSESSNYHSWASKVVLELNVTLNTYSDGINECKEWQTSEESVRRRSFCNDVEGYGDICSCLNPLPITFHPNSLQQNKVLDTPVCVIASNRPQYLYRMLISLLSADGVNASMVTVFIDGYYEEPSRISQLFGVRAIKHVPLGKNMASRVSQHYKLSILSTFELFPSAKNIIIVEEDLDVSKDFFSYFSQTAELLEKDPSLYCISAWNDLGYNHTSSDPSILHRVETMPGLGWMMKRSLFEQELYSMWPGIEKGSASTLIYLLKYGSGTSVNWDWDMWIKSPPIRKGRECIVPEVSRTYHFGSVGLNVNSYFQDLYFNSHSFYSQDIVQFKNITNLVKDKYEEFLTKMISTSQPVDHSLSPCDEAFIPTNNEEKSLVVYIKMMNSRDFTTWLEIARCFKIWDLDARGYHKSTWRLRKRDKEVIVVGVPSSQYSYLKPSNITPIFIERIKADGIHH